MNRTVLTSLVLAVISTGFAGCDSSDNSNPAPLNPGTQAGYAQAGSSACSQEITDAVDQIGQSIRNLRDETNDEDPNAGRPDQLKQLEAEVKIARKDAVEYQQNYAGVSCIATIDGKTLLVNSDKLNSQVAELDSLSEKFKKEEADLSTASDHRGDSKQ